MPEEERPVKKQRTCLPRSIAACARCRTRKSKCDGNLPTCGQCAKAGVECIGYDHVAKRTFSRSYLYDLENQVEDLTKKLAEANSALAQANSNNSNNNNNYNNNINNSTFNNARPATNGSTNSTSAQDAQKKSHAESSLLQPTKPPNDKVFSSPVDGFSVGNLVITSLGADSSENPATTASSVASSSVSVPPSNASNTPPSSDYQGLQQQQQQQQKQQQQQNGLNSSNQNNTTNSNTAASNTVTTNDNKSTDLHANGSNNNEIAVVPNAQQQPINHCSKALPSPEVIRQFFDVYRFTFHHSTPLFHEADLEAVVRRVCNDPQSASAEDCFLILIILAIATYFLSRLLKPTSELRRTSEAFHALALEFAKPSFFTHDIPGLQRILLLAHYSFFNPSRGSAWYLTGMAARLCIDIGLHNENQYQIHGPKNAKETDIKRSILWSTYTLDRAISSILGRPPNLPDRWISTPFPALEDDANITEEGIIPGPPAEHKVHTRAVFQFRVLQSELQDRVHATTAKKPPDSWFIDFQSRLDNFYKSIPKTGSGMTSDFFFLLAYHLAIVQLYRPSPAVPGFSEDAMKKCLQASQVIVDLYRKAFRCGKLHHIWGSVHHLFIAGVTFLNALWRAHQAQLPCRPSLVDATITIQECSSVLQALASFVPNASGCHESFENLSSTVLKHLRATVPHETLHKSTSSTKAISHANGHYDKPLEQQKHQVQKQQQNQQQQQHVQKAQQAQRKIRKRSSSSMDVPPSNEQSNQYQHVNPTNSSVNLITNKTSPKIQSVSPPAVSSTNSSYPSPPTAQDSAKTLADLISLPADLHALDDILTNPNNPTLTNNDFTVGSTHAFNIFSGQNLTGESPMPSLTLSSDSNIFAASSTAPSTPGGGMSTFTNEVNIPSFVSMNNEELPPSTDLTEGLGDLQDLFIENDLVVHDGQVEGGGVWGSMLPL